MLENTSHFLYKKTVFYAKNEFKITRNSVKIFSSIRK